MIPDYGPLLAALEGIPALRAWGRRLPAQIAAGLSPARWGDLPAWRAALDRLPALRPGTLDLRTGVRIGRPEEAGDGEREALRAALMELHPWRKGPFELFGLHLDSEWRSDWKWQRLAPQLDDLGGRLVLDVGCGNGYYCLRMLGAGARRVIGIDPAARFVMQFEALRRYTGPLPADVLPLGIEQLPERLAAFDTLFSMGVLYHRRSPFDHLRELRELLRPGGQLVLETLVIEGGPGQVLVPEDRYAKMPNVWFLPSPDTLLAWLRKAGFRTPRLVDVTPTTPQEQRRTPWMRFESLADFLDPADPTLTLEGHPAPRRGIFLAWA
ncbi:MAG: tRNA 5-methoxyuridine(34)/uridine 5-oxyacetic acid(34) synthase CmoB [Pseudomonadota bacterium]|jgi:tRNA (mo5U34)-methyltransferase